jgi:hypothetical protein
MNMTDNTSHCFPIKYKDLLWSAKTFSMSVVTAFVCSMLLYTFMFIIAEPAPVNEAIVSTATAATAKVVVTAEYISPMWAIFIFNSIAALSASVGTGLFLFIHLLLVSDIRLRPNNRIYASFSIAFERMLMPANRLLQKLAHRLDNDFPYPEISDPAKEGIWRYCGYTREDYRMFAYMLPYTIPFMIMIVNGLLMGILLAFFLFNGSLTGYEMLGIKGIAIGIAYNLTYFFISIVPHGIIEIPAILLAAALGYRFARVQSLEVKSKGLFLGNSPESLKEDVSEVLATVRLYLTSRYLWKISAFIVITLLAAAYIEAHLTSGIVDIVMQELDIIIEKLLL